MKLKKYFWRRAALRPVLLLILVVMAIGLLLARALIPQPEPSTFALPSANQAAQLDSGPETVLQAAHDAQGSQDAQDAQPASQTGGSSKAAEASEMKNGDSEQSVKQQKPAAVGPLRGNLQSKVFHLPGCRNYECKSCTQVFQTRKEALAAGYRPCKQCAQ